MVDVLLRARRDGELVICDVVAAELFAVLLSETKFRRVLLDLSIEFSPITVESAKRAGRVFRAYRHAGGPRQHLVPDFLIAAHAAVQADQIAARDRGYMRRYFPRLRIVARGDVRSRCARRPPRRAAATSSAAGCTCREVLRRACGYVGLPVVS